MNKLRKHQHRLREVYNIGTQTGDAAKTGHSALLSPSLPQSRTMMYARALAPVANTATGTATPMRLAINIPPVVKSAVTAEQYWAARALTAEALLSARVVHQGDLVASGAIGREKRTHEVVAQHSHYEARDAELKTVVIVLSCCLVTSVGLIVYSYSRNVRHPEPTGWSIPTHFTIPILSPFTSVVEHETSAISTRLVVSCAAILATLAYACFRHWANVRHR